MYKSPKSSVFLLLFIGILIYQGCQTIPKKTLNNQTVNHIIRYADEHLSQEGILIQQADGYAYLKVNDDYIHKLFPILNVKGFTKPPYFRRPDAPGAHISIIYENEGVRLKETGQKFSFVIKDIALVNPNKDTSYIILTLEAPELEKIRMSYGLTPKLKGHEFHITIAKKTIKTKN